MRRIAFVVHGRVQGVGFRAAAHAEARRLGLTGFVRNRADGAVEGEAQGPADGLAAFAAWLGSGPRFARVIRVAADDLPPVAGEHTFAVRR
ncbi:MAG: acylphosphatase [Planctomycetes bacterium]|nr:acylphosphatase [Planctomycetota bacterium]